MPRMTIEDLAETFDLLGDWEERYAYLIELGRKLPPLTDAEREQRDLRAPEHARILRRQAGLEHGHGGGLLGAVARQALGGGEPQHLHADRLEAAITALDHRRIAALVDRHRDLERLAGKIDDRRADYLLAGQLVLAEFLLPQLLAQQGLRRAGLPLGGAGHLVDPVEPRFGNGPPTSALFQRGGLGALRERTDGKGFLGHIIPASSAAFCSSWTFS